MSLISSTTDEREFEIAALNQALDEFLEPYLGGLEQRSDAWHEFRLTSIGGSQIASLFGMNPYQDRNKVIEDFRKRQAGGKVPMMGAACWWGTMFEPVITRFVEIDLGTTVKGDDITIPTDFGHHNSPDGYCVVRECVRTSGARPETSGRHATLVPKRVEDPEETFQASVALLEFKCPYRRKPKGTVPEHYQPQVWSGLALSPVADFGLFVDAVFRKTPLSSFGFSRHYDFDYHRERCTWGKPAAVGFEFLYAMRPDAPGARRQAEEETRWCEERGLLAGPGMAEPAVELYQINVRGGLGGPQFASPARDTQHPAALPQWAHGLDLGDSSACSPWDFDRALYHIDRKHLRRWSAEPLTASECCTASDAPSSAPDAPHTALDTYIRNTFEEAERQCPDDHYLFGYIPWKLFEVHYVPVERREDFLDILKPMVEAFHRDVRGGADATQDPDAALGAEAKKDLLEEFLDGMYKA